MSGGTQVVYIYDIIFLPIQKTTRANQIAKGCRERLRAARNIGDVVLGRLKEEQAEVKKLRARVMWWDAWWAELPGWPQKKVKAVKRRPPTCAALGAAPAGWTPTAARARGGEPGEKTRRQAAGRRKGRGGRQADRRDQAGGEERRGEESRAEERRGKERRGE